MSNRFTVAVTAQTNQYILSGVYKQGGTMSYLQTECGRSVFFEDYNANLAVNVSSSTDTLGEGPESTEAATTLGIDGDEDGP